VTDVSAQLANMRSLCKDAELWEEGGKPLAFLPSLKVHSDGEIHTVDGLLCPRERDSYETRLFLSKPFTGKVGAWNAFNIKGRTWYSCSWQGVPATLPWLEILGSHLSPLQ
jgi:hypothetical protein